MQGRLFAGHCAAVRSHSTACDDGNFSSPKECALAPVPDRMHTYGGMSKGCLRRFFPSAEVFGTFCVKKYSKNDNRKNIRQQVKGKLC